jgi:putative PEP-CTERM system histidine kinase
MPTDANLLMVAGQALAGLAYLGLTLRLLWQRGQQTDGSKAARAILPATVVSVVWAWSVPALQLSQLDGVWLWLPRWFDVARYGLWFAFLLHLLGKARGDGGHRSTLARRLTWVAGGLTVVTAVTPHFMPMTVLAVFGLVLIEQLFRNLPVDARWSAKPICLGLAGTLLFDVYLFSEAALFNGVDPDVAAARGFVHALMVPLLILPSARHRNWMSKIQVSRQVVFHSATLMIAGLYLLFISSVGYYVRYFGGQWGRVLQVALVFLAVVGLVALALSGTLRARLRVWLGKHFLRYRYDYREEWLKFTRALSSHSQPQELSQHVIRGLADMVESPAGALWLLNAEHSHYVQVARWNMPQATATEPLESALVQFMKQTGWVIDLREFQDHPDRYAGLTLPGWLHDLPQAWLVVPLPIGGEQLGFVLLAQPRTPLELNWEVTDLLKTAAAQAASFLAQMQATEALLESRKFDAFNRMSAFVVHDLKNIVTQLSLMVKNAKRLQHNPEFQADMLMTVENSLERMKQLMMQLREGAAPSGGAVGVDLGAMAQEWARSAQSRGRTVRLDLQPDVFTRGHAERLKRVVGHLIQNALDATEHHGQDVWVKSHRFGSHASLQVGDNGVGMSEEFVRTRLFKPFQTTKTAGMGIGAYESLQYIQELGGKMTVESKEGEGTLVTLLLPVMDVAQPGNILSGDGA